MSRGTRQWKLPSTGAAASGSGHLGVLGLAKGGGQETDKEFDLIDMKLIEPGKNPRRKIGDVAGLAKNIKEIGLIEPIVVRRIGQGRYELIAGARRLKACQKNGRRFIEAIIENVDSLRPEDDPFARIAENLQREDLTADDLSAAVYELIKVHGFKAVRVAEKLGHSKSWVSEKVLHAELLLSVPSLDGKLDSSAAAAIQREQDPARKAAMIKLAKKGQNVRSAIMEARRSGGSSQSASKVAGKKLQEPSVKLAASRVWESLSQPERRRVLNALQVLDELEIPKSLRG